MCCFLGWVFWSFSWIGIGILIGCIFEILRTLSNLIFVQTYSHLSFVAKIKKPKDLSTLDRPFGFLFLNGRRFTTKGNCLRALGKLKFNLKFKLNSLDRGLCEIEFRLVLQNVLHCRSSCSHYPLNPTTSFLKLETVPYLEYSKL